MHRRSHMLVLIVLAQVSSSLLAQGLPTLFAFLQADFRLSRAELGLFLAAVEGGAVATFILGGWAADALGVRWLIPLSQALFGAVGLVFAQVTSYEMGLVVLPLAGFALGLGSPALSLAVVHWFPARGRGTAMGIKQTGVPLAAMLAAALLPSVALAYGWRTGISLVGLTSLALGVVTLLLYRDPPDARPRRVMMRLRWSDVGGLLRQRDLWVVNSFAAVLFAAQLIFNGYLILYLREQLGVPVVAGGLILAVAQGGAFCGRIAWGLVSDLLLRGRRVPAIALAGALAAALLATLALLPASAPLWMLVLLAFGVGFSAMGWHGLRHALVMELFPPGVAGLTFGVSQTMAEVGPILGPPLFGAVADHLGYRPAWLGLAGLTTIVTALLARALDERAPAARRLAGEPTASAAGASAREGG